MKLEIIAMSEDLIPKKAYENDACFDIYSAEDTVVPAVSNVSVSTGIRLSIPEGFYIEIRPRSGLMFKHGIEAFCGTIDCSYLNEVKVLLKNYNIEPYRIKRGDRIAQMRLVKLEPTEIVEVDSFGDAFDRGGGFGSTGR